MRRTTVGFWCLAGLALAVTACGDPTPADDLAGDPATDVVADVPADAPTDAPPADVPADVPTDVPTQDVPDVPQAPGKARFLHISDLHVYGDGQNPLTGPLQKAVGILNALPFDADFVVATGDYVDFLPDGIRAGTPSTFTACLDTLGDLRWPVRTMAGNHEYYRSELLDPTTEKAERDAYLNAAMGHGTEESFDVRGVRFLALNTMQGDQWNASNGLAGSFTDAQLAWIRGQLDAGLPTVLLLHHPPTSGAETATGDSLCKALADRPGVVKGVFAGHLHGFWRGEACGVPYWLVGNTDPDKPFFFEVEVDGVTGAVTVVNEADIPFAEIPEFTCDPAADAGFDPATTVGTNQVLRVGHLVSNLPGLEGMEGDGLDKVPLVVRVDAWDPATKQATARLSQGLPDQDFIGVMPGAPCVALTFDVAGACAASREVAFDLDLLPLLRAMMDITPDPSWQARLEVKGFRLEGRLASAEGAAPRFEEGLLHLSASGTRALDDLKGILVTEYCAGRIPECVPGAADMPACPEPAGPAFFDDVPEACDVPVGTYSLRLVLGLLAAYPLDNVALVGAFTTDPRPASATPQPGAVDEAMFSSDAGANCESPVR